MTIADLLEQQEVALDAGDVAEARKLLEEIKEERYYSGFPQHVIPSERSESRNLGFRRQERPDSSTPFSRCAPFGRSE